ncbi:ceramide glucosyltransferase [Azospirillaceae bacterium]
MSVMDVLSVFSYILLIPVMGGTVYALLCFGAAAILTRRSQRQRPPSWPEDAWPGVSLLKPIYGLEKDLAENLRSACLQNYPGPWQVVLSAQRLDDPALPELRRIADAFGPERVSLVVAEKRPVVNGKLQHLMIAFEAARHPILVISDSDVRLTPTYLRTVVAPLADPAIGGVCTFYRATRAETWSERLEQLTLNADFIPNLIFAEVSGAADFCLGASTAIRRDVLERIGGFDSLAEYLVEDYEMGRRIRAIGFEMVILPYFVDMMVDHKHPSDGWRRLVYWDQNTRAARPMGFFATILTRSIPFAVFFALSRGFDSLGLIILASALAARLIAGTLTLSLIGDEASVRNLALLPIRDMIGLASWAAALIKNTFTWRGQSFGLTREGKIIPKNLSEENINISSGVP